MPLIKIYGDTKIYDKFVVGKASTWTPAQMQTVFWYDAADLSTITASGNRVTQMLDKSGNGLTLAPLSVNKIGPDTGTRTLNGLNVLGFNKTVSSNQVLENNTFNHPQPLCIASVIRFDDEGVAGDQDFIFSGTESTDNRLSIRRNGATSSWQIISPFVVGSGNNTAVEGFEYITSFSFNTDNTTIRVNGMQLNSGTIPNISFSSLNIGSNELEVFQLDGFIAEMLAFANPADQQIVEGYLAWKWGLQSNLSINHPYKNSAPLAY